MQNSHKGEGQLLHYPFPLILSGASDALGVTSSDSVLLCPQGGRRWRKETHTSTPFPRTHRLLSSGNTDYHLLLGTEKCSWGHGLAVKGHQCLRCTAKVHGGFDVPRGDEREEPEAVRDTIACRRKSLAVSIPALWGFLGGNAHPPLGLFLNSDSGAGGSMGRAPTLSVGGGQAVLVGSSGGHQVSAAPAASPRLRPRDIPVPLGCVFPPFSNIITSNPSKQPPPGSPDLTSDSRRPPWSRCQCDRSLEDTTSGSRSPRGAHSPGAILEEGTALQGAGREHLSTVLPPACPTFAHHNCPLP